MEVLCYKKSRDLFGFLIRWWTWGPYSHTELRFSDGVCFSSSWVKERRGTIGLRAGTRFKDIPVKPENWDCWKINITPAAEERVRQWCARQVGKPYDLLGILGFVLRKSLDAPFAWYCSEICAHALNIFGIGKFPSRVSPNGMAALMRDQPDVFTPVN